MSRHPDVDDVARRGAPYPYPDPLPDDVRRAHTAAVTRAEAWFVALTLVFCLAGGTAVTLLFAEGSDLEHQLPEWTGVCLLVVVSAASTMISTRFRRRAKRHKAVLDAYSATGSPSTRPRS